MRSPRWIASGLLGVALANSAAALDLPVKLRLEAAGAWTENLSRTSGPATRQDAVRTQTSLTASTLREWTTGFMTTSEFALGAEHTPDFPRLDALTLGPRLQARRKFGLGAYAAVIEAGAGLQRRDARIAGNDGWLATASLRLAKRITAAWRVALTADWHQHYARSSTFDTRDRRLHGSVTWDVTPHWQVSAGAGRLWGQIAANATAATWTQALAGGLGPAVFAYYRTVPWTTTDSFGPGWVTYRVAARGDFHWFELSPALGRNTSLPLRYERLLIVNRIGVRYPQDTVSLSILHRF